MEIVGIVIVGLLIVIVIIAIVAKVVNDKNAMFDLGVLQPYKKETMDKVNKAVFDANAQCCDIMNHLIKKETMEGNLTIQDIRDNNAEWLLNKLREMPAVCTLRTISDLYDELHKQQYPKTYGECCEIIGAQRNRHYFYTMRDKQDYPHEVAIMSCLDNLKRLLICRDAYWQIAGERMKLDKPWDPDWTISEYKFTIVEIAGIVVKSIDMCNKHILAFPTEEMRDAFYENFKDLMEACKEFL
jgi:glutaredoxin-related protein